MYKIHRTVSPTPVMVKCLVFSVEYSSGSEIVGQCREVLKVPSHSSSLSPITKKRCYISVVAVQCCCHRKRVVAISVFPTCHLISVNAALILLHPLPFLRFYSLGYIIVVNPNVIYQYICPACLYLPTTHHTRDSIEITSTLINTINHTVVPSSINTPLHAHEGCGIL